MTVTDYTPTEFEIWAGRLIACGLNVVPVRPRSKMPAVEWARWQTERQAEADWNELDGFVRE